MIKLTNVSKIYNTNGINTTGLHNISLELHRNEIVVITGQSGCGKSTLLNVITKMDNFDEGEIYYKGNETSYFDVNDMDDFRKNKVGFILQNYNILDSYTVLENVMVPLRLKGVPKAEAKKKALELIEKVGLSHRVKNRGTELSGGEKQRCVIARALASDCEIFACDEPTGNLDSKTGAEIIKLIAEVAKDKLVLIVSHNPDEVKDIATRSIKMHDGQIMEDIVLKDTKTIDKNEEINLDYVPVKEKTKFDISLSNMVNTPKKTFLACLVIVFVCIFTLCLYQAIFYSNDNILSYNNFAYQSENKEFVYRSDDKPLDINELKNISDKFTINEFFIEKKYLTSLNSDYVVYLVYEAYPSLDGLKGRMPTNDDEVIIVSKCPSEHLLNKRFNFDSENSIIQSKYSSFKIVGYVYDDSLPMYTSIVTGNTYLENLLKLQRLTLNYTANTDLRYADVIFDPSESQTKCYGDIDLNIQFYAFRYSRYEFVYNYHVPYDNSNVNKVVIGKDVMDLINSTCYEASVYGNYKTVGKQLDKIGYSHVNTLRYDESDELNRLISNIETYVLIILSSIIILVVYFISYAVLSKIFQAKNKEYLVLRTLGVTKKDMASIVRIELMLETILIETLVFFTFFIISRFTKWGIFMIFTKYNAVVVVIYFLVMLLFGFLLSNRLNTRLFKFSVSKSFKKGEAK